MRSVPLLCLALAAAVLVPSAVPASAVAGDAEGFDPAEADAFVADYLDRHGLPGAAVAVVRDGETVFEAGYGEDSRGEPLTEHSRLRIGSVSKSFTAFAALRLADEGRLDLDAPVGRYLPDVGFGRAITVRQLLAHTSGLPNPTIVGPADTLEEGAARTRDWTTVTEPGTDYAYSNANYWLAARVVEEASGRPFDDYLADRVFAPLGMDETVNATTTGDHVDGLADGYVTAYGTVLPAAGAEEMNSGAGGVVSTAHDMASWLAMQQRGGVGPGGRRLLPEELIRQSHTPQRNAERSGLGWKRSSPGIAPARISHSGITSGFNAQQDLVPSSGYGVAVLLNSFTPSREQAYEISSGIIDLTEGRDPDPGAPTATLVDLSLGALTLLTLSLGTLGLRRASGWAARRASWSAWRFVPRLLPQVAAAVPAVLLFLVAPALQDNSYTPVDAFLLFPALTVLLAALALVGAVLTAARVAARLRARPRP
ncbi:serine hydrolase domain-containing protein [Streptomonospora wellingtoniae]|uniref:Serine hydrolase domain-containing protein n=1 Tax=Streptomonospora wellingtoniae TaxID=3075544 RepID=A0ABU2KRM0_9ACTN|nr:serine hydrolase domain-containing protein [Streptomonospora sp. DSM 45055]MDT0301936.1 serine hydrolase domain-containing protein [Streptomonospora sp. DSM 45055]